MAAPFFSVIIPVFNRAGSLARAIESVRAQSFQDFEIVAVDDGSTDDPHAVVNSFVYSRIRYCRQPNGGGGAARGLAILITELDVEDTGGPSDIAARDRAVADEARADSWMWRWTAALATS